MGWQALHMLRDDSANPDVVLLDFHMPMYAMAHRWLF